ncbi:NUDIX hydrolase [Mogibacterium diversum]|uniref:NUDIX hydrolase n=1 Tax=Mogibacterium diversum TaxID=114527 RepID=UPI0026EBA73C|nr:CoA pyrophosphatase [Mogibacterium diversum]
MRAINLRRQPGEICFPGGSTMEGEPPAHAAIREASEELLIAPSSIEVLDELDVVNIYSGGTLQPIVGLLRDYDYTFSSDEVAEVFTMPLAFFLENQPERYDVAMRSIPVEGFPYDRIEGGKAYAWDSSYRTIYFYQHDGRNIWGLTAGIVNDFIEKIKRGGYLK